MSTELHGEYVSHSVCSCACFSVHTDNKQHSNVFGIVCILKSHFHISWRRWENWQKHKKKKPCKIFNYKTRFPTVGGVLLL